MSGFLCVPREVWDWPRRDWAIAYTDLQFRAAWAARDVVSKGCNVRLEPGELLFSTREAARWWGWGDKAVRVFVDHLEAEGLIEYPEGKEHRRLFRLKLSAFWGESRGAKKGASKGDSKGAKKPRSDKDLEGEGAQAGAQERAQAGARYKEYELGDEKEITDTDTSYPTAEAVEPRPALSLVRGGGQEQHDDPSRLGANLLLAEWLKRQPIQLSERDRGKQAAAAKRICDAYSRVEIQTAWWGLTHRFPWARAPGSGKGGEPWDLMTLEREFAKSVQYAADNHPDARRLREEAEFQAALQRKASGF